MNYSSFCTLSVLIEPIDHFDLFCLLKLFTSALTCYVVWTHHLIAFWFDFKSGLCLPQLWLVNLYDICTGCPKKNARLRLEANNSSLEGVIGICKTIFGFLRFSAFIWAQEVQDLVNGTWRKSHFKRATLTWKQA